MKSCSTLPYVEIRMLRIVIEIVHVRSFVCKLLVTLWSVATRLLYPWDFPRPEYWSGWTFPSPGSFLNKGSNAGPLPLLHRQADSLPVSHLRSLY